MSDNKLTELELLLMQIFWTHGELSVPEMQKHLKEQGKTLAPSSIRTMLGILLKKGVLTRREHGRGFIYKAVAEQGNTQKNILRDIINRAFNGSAFSLISTLLDDNMIKKNDLEKVKELISEAEQGE